MYTFECMSVVVGESACTYVCVGWCECMYIRMSVLVGVSTCTYVCTRLKVHMSVLVGVSAYTYTFECMSV